jgi:hypothetical protein
VTSPSHLENFLEACMLPQQKKSRWFNIRHNLIDLAYDSYLPGADILITGPY